MNEKLLAILLSNFIQAPFDANSANLLVVNNFFLRSSSERPIRKKINIGRYR